MTVSAVTVARVRSGDIELSALERATRLHGGLAELEMTVGFDDPLFKAARVAQQVLSLAIQQPPLPPALPESNHEQVARAAPRLRKTLDRLAALAFGFENETERRFIVNAVVHEGHAVRARLSSRRNARALAVLRDLRRRAGEAGKIPFLETSAMAVLTEHHIRYGRSLDLSLLIDAIAAAAQEADRGGGKPGALPRGSFNHLDALCSLIRTAGLAAPIKGVRAEYTAARKLNADPRRAIAAQASVRKVSSHEAATPSGSPSRRSARPPARRAPRPR